VALVCHCGPGELCLFMHSPFTELLCFELNYSAKNFVLLTLLVNYHCPAIYSVV
jgi:hypothetical protein